MTSIAGGLTEINDPVAWNKVSDAFRRHGQPDLHSQLLNEIRNGVLKDFIELAITIALREMLNKSTTRLSTSRKEYPDRKEQREHLDELVLEILPNWIRDKAKELSRWKSNRATAIRILRECLPAGWTQNDPHTTFTTEELIKFTFGDWETEREAELKSIEESKCKWAKQFNIQCGENCFFKNIHEPKKLWRVQVLDLDGKEIELCVRPLCPNGRIISHRACGTHINLTYENRYGLKFEKTHCIPWLAGMLCSHWPIDTHKIPICQAYQEEKICSYGPKCRNLHQRWHGNKLIAAEYTMITEFPRPLFELTGTVEAAQKMILSRKTRPWASINVSLEQQGNLNKSQIEEKRMEIKSSTPETKVARIVGLEHFDSSSSSSSSRTSSSNSSSSSSSSRTSSSNSSSSSSSSRTSSSNSSSSSSSSRTSSSNSSSSSSSSRTSNRHSSKSPDRHGTPSPKRRRISERSSGSLRSPRASLRFSNSSNSQSSGTPRGNPTEVPGTPRSSSSSNNSDTTTESSNISSSTSCPTVPQEPKLNFTLKFGNGPPPTPSMWASKLKGLLYKWKENIHDTVSQITNRKISIRWMCSIPPLESNKKGPLFCLAKETHFQGRVQVQLTDYINEMAIHLSLISQASKEDNVKAITVIPIIGDITNKDAKKLNSEWKEVILQQIYRTDTFYVRLHCCKCWKIAKDSAELKPLKSDTLDGSWIMNSNMLTKELYQCLSPCVPPPIPAFS